MKYLIGQQRCAGCGHLETYIVDVDESAWQTKTACDVCGETAASMGVMFPATYWPLAETLVRFDVERKRLGLPTLDAEPLQ